MRPTVCSWHVIIRSTRGPGIKSRVFWSQDVNMNMWREIKGTLSAPRPHWVCCTRYQVGLSVARRGRTGTLLLMKPNRKGNVFIFSKLYLHQVTERAHPEIRVGYPVTTTTTTSAHSQMSSLSLSFSRWTKTKMRSDAMCDVTRNRHVGLLPKSVIHQMNPISMRLVVVGLRK